MARFDIKHAKSLTQAEWTGTVSIANSSGGPQSVQASKLVGPDEWNSLHQVTFGLSKSDMVPFGFYIPHALIGATNQSGIGTAASWSAQPIGLPYPINSGHIRLQGSHDVSLSNQNFSAASPGSFSKTNLDRHLGALYAYSGDNQWSSQWSTIVSSAWTQSMTCQTTVQTSRIAITEALTLSMPSQFDSAGGMTYGTSSTSASTIISASTVTGDTATKLISALFANVSGRRQWLLPLASRVEPGAYIFMHALLQSGDVSSSRYGNTLPGNMTILNNVAGASWAGFKQPWVSDSSMSTRSPDVPRGQFKTATLSASSKIHVSDFNIGGASAQDMIYMRFNGNTL